jgi:hypothetical protein
VFFEPLPPQTIPEQRQWSAPLWDRPSEGTIPAVFAVNEPFIQDDDVVVMLDTLGVYPNGFTIQVSIHLNPHRSQELMQRVRGPGRMQMVRAGVRFADGREGGRRPQGRAMLVKNEEGIPTGPYVRFHGGAGGGDGWHYGFWVFPLPPAGPLEIFIGISTDEPMEARVTLDGAQVRTAARQARVVWT